MVCWRSLSLLLPFAVADTEVAYFRFANHDKTTQLDSVSSDSTVQLREWSTTYKIFDSPQDVKVQRLDIDGTPSGTATLYQDELLSLEDGPAYIFSNASAVRFEDHTGTKSSMEYTDSVAWISKASCVKLSVDLSAHGKGSLIVVSSGNPSMTGQQDTSSCEAATVLVGTPALARNEVSYRVSPEHSCKKALNHGRDGYSVLDQPIRPLGAHYHTRGSLYYALYGRAEFNDVAIEDSFLLGGELRFVAPGVWYGPETMADDTYVASVHEVDPSAIVHYSPPSPTPNTCAFACQEQDVTPAKCVKAEPVAEIRVV
jgi:hypothetical protein